MSFGNQRNDGKVTQTAGLMHSYMVQPTISADRLLCSPVLVVLQEPGEKFGPRVKAQMFKRPELNVHCTSCGLVDKSTLSKYFKLFSKYPQAKDSVLLYDSYRGYVDQNNALRQSISNEFKEFTTRNNIEHIFTAPGQPSSNGQAENFVKTVKTPSTSCIL